MGAYKDNFEEQHARYKYKKENHYIAVVTVFLSSWFIVAILSPESYGFSKYLFSLPSPFSPFTYVSLVALVAGSSLWGGIPKILHFSFVPDLLKYGRKQELQQFFYPEVDFTDGVPRAKEFKYLRDRHVTPHNLFDYDPLTDRHIEGRTLSVFVSLFRDKKRERLVEMLKSEDSKKRELAKKHLKKYDEDLKDQPSSGQEFLYDDLFRAIEGIIQSYEIVIDGKRYAEIVQRDMRSPLELERREDGNYTVRRIDESIDVFEDNNIYFSLAMLRGTTDRISRLFAQRLRIRAEVGGSVLSSTVSGKFGGSLEESFIRQCVDYFQFVFFRRLLLNYGSMPSGWYVGRMEDYDMRAIISAVDRDMIPTITSVNDGSSKIFGDDRFAAKFLYAYWDFMRDPIVSSYIEAIDWCFDTVKDLNEIKAREMSASLKANSDNKEGKE